MHETLDILVAEHRVIERIVGALGRIAALAIEERPVPIEAAAECVDLMRACTDAYHHGKEEHILFPVLSELAGWRLNVPVQVLNGEHEIGRGRVREMAKAVADGLKGEGRRTFWQNAVAYQGLLRLHIRKEDLGLFPTADKALNDKEKMDLLLRYETFERESPQRLPDYRRRVGELEGALVRI